MKVFAGGINTETNTFSPVPTGLTDFIIGRADVVDNPCECQVLNTLEKLTLEQGWTFCPSFIAFAEPGGITTRQAYEHLRDQLLADLQQAMPVDMVFLPLHGAMVATGYEDCEGDIISRVRSVVGPYIPIGVELDPHCHLTDLMVASADLIAIYREYPHTDILARAEALFDMLTDVARGCTRPTMALFDCRIINLYPTAHQPMRMLVDSLPEYEQHPDIISVDIAHGFPWGDVPDCGTRTLAVANNNPALAQQVAAEIGQVIYENRGALLLRSLSLDEALTQAESIPDSLDKPLVIADQSDNPGGGAAGDSTFALAAVIERQMTDCALGMVWDPQVVNIAKNAGEGAQIKVRLGGKTATTSGSPLDIDVTVQGVRENMRQYFPQTGADDIQVPCGDVVCLVHQGIYIIVNSVRTQVFSPGVFTAFGLKLEQLKTIVVKSTFHFHAAFAPVAADILLMAPPGPLNTRFTDIPYQHVNRHKYPWLDDPFFEE